MKSTFSCQDRWNALFVFGGIMVPLFVPQVALSAEAGTAKTVVVVNGTDILLKDIQVSLDQVKDTLRLRSSVTFGKTAKRKNDF